MYAYTVCTRLLHITACTHAHTHMLDTYHDACHTQPQYACLWKYQL